MYTFHDSGFYIAYGYTIRGILSDIFSEFSSREKQLMWALCLSVRLSVRPSQHLVSGESVFRRVFDANLLVIVLAPEPRKISAWDRL